MICKRYEVERCEHKDAMRDEININVNHLDRTWIGYARGEDTVKTNAYDWRRYKSKRMLAIRFDVWLFYELYLVLQNNK